MDSKKIGIGILAIVLVAAAIWIFLISSYEEDLGTKNEFTAQD